MSSRDTQRRLRIMLRQTWLITLGVLLLFGSLVGASLYIELQPTTLRIAVGPADGEDAHLVQAIAQQLTRDRAAIRLKPILKDNATDSAAALDADQAELAVIRRDRAYPKQGLAVAVLRENVVVMIVPAPGSLAPAGTSAKGAKTAKAKKTEKQIEKVEQIAGHTVGVIGRGGANTDLLNLVLKQYEVPADKVKIVSLDPDDVKTALRNNPVDVIFGAGPVTSHFFADAIAAASKGDDQPKFLEISGAAAIAKRLPVYEATEIKKGVFGGHSPLPEDDIDTDRLLPLHRGAEVAFRCAGRRSHQAPVRRPPEPCLRLSGDRADDEAGHRQGCRGACASRRRRLHRRRGEDLLRQIQRFHLSRHHGVFRLRLRRRLARELFARRRPHPQAQGARNPARHRRRPPALRRPTSNSTGCATTSTTWCGARCIRSSATTSTNPPWSPFRSHSIRHRARFRSGGPY